MDETILNGVDTATDTNYAGESVNTDAPLSSADQTPTEVMEGTPEVLPEQASARTKEQFGKLLENNKALSARLKELEQQTANIGYSGNLPAQDYVDFDGNVDIQRLNRDLAQAKQEAQSALQMVKAQSEKAEEREAYSKYPQLNPSSPEFDQSAYDLVVDRVVRKRYIEGQDIPLVDIANEVFKSYRPSVAQEREEAINQYKRVEEQKSQTTPVSSGKGQPRETTARYEDVRKASQQGDSSAIQERLRNLGIVK